MRIFLCLFIVCILLSACSPEGTRPKEIREDMWNDLAELVILHHETYINQSNYVKTTNPFAANDRDLANVQKMTSMLKRQNEIIEKYFDLQESNALNEDENKLFIEVSRLTFVSATETLNKLGIAKSSDDELQKEKIEYRDKYVKLKTYFGITEQKEKDILSFVK